MSETKRNGRSRIDVEGYDIENKAVKVKGIWYVWSREEGKVNEEQEEEVKVEKAIESWIDARKRMREVKEREEGREEEETKEEKEKEERDKINEKKEEEENEEDVLNLKDILIMRKKKLKNNESEV